MADLTLTGTRKSIEVFAGTNRSLTFVIANAAGVIPITNDEVKFTAKDKPGGSVVKIPTLTNGVGEHSSPAAGETTFALTPAMLENATPRPVTWWYEVRLVRADGDEDVHVYGPLTILPAVGTGV